MDYSSLKILGMENMNIDPEKSYDYIDPTNNYHTINAWLKKDVLVYCPTCGTLELKYRSTVKTTINYTSKYEQNIVVNLTRRVYKCQACGKYCTEPNPFVDGRDNIAVSTKLAILEDLKNETLTFKYIAGKYNVSIQSVINIFDEHISCRRLKLEEILCWDEIYVNKLGPNKYSFVMYSPYRKKIIDIHYSRKKYDLVHYFSCINDDERNIVKYICIDLYETYRSVAKTFFPDAIIAADSFHVIENLQKAFNDIRIRVMKNFKANDRETKFNYFLYKKYYKLLLTDKYEDIYTKRKIKRYGVYLSYSEIKDKILSLSNELKKAYDLKEEYRNFNLREQFDDIEKELDEITIKFKEIGIDEFYTFYKLLKNWRQEIINSLKRYNGHRISNGAIEGINKRLKLHINVSYGCTKFIRYRNRVMYIINKNTKTNR